MTTPGTQGELSPESMGKTASSAVGSPPDAKPAPHCTTGNTADQNRLKPYKGKPFELSNELKLKVKKEIPVHIPFRERFHKLVRFFMLIALRKRRRQ
jgi:hypothetical protein